MRLHLSLFLKQLCFYVPGLIITLIVAQAANQARLASHASIEPVTFTWTTLFFVVLIMTTLIIVVRRLPRVAHALFGFSFFLIVFLGAQIALGLRVGSSSSVVMSFVLVLLLLFRPVVVLHDAAVLVGLVGIAVIIGIGVTPLAGVMVLMILSVYDIISVHRTGHTPEIARSMIESGYVFGFFFPLEWRGFLKPVRNTVVGDDAMLLGSGDVGLPLFFISAVSVTSMPHAWVVAIFSIGGLFVTHLMFTSQRKRQPMAALPPIALSCILGYLVAVLFI